MKMEYQTNKNTNILPEVGVGLRHVHFAEAVSSIAPIDFVEVHTENFYAKGGASKAVLLEIAKHYPISLHSTALGLGSIVELHRQHLENLKRLVELIDPILVSDHASFSWGSWEEKSIHSGDLLPISFLDVLASNVNKVQNSIDRDMSIENLTANVQYDQFEMNGATFLVKLTEMTGCKLLLDLNNVIVNILYENVSDSEAYALDWLERFPKNLVGEIHFAGFNGTKNNRHNVDDHSQAVSPIFWRVYSKALNHFDPAHTLIEWDNNILNWQILIVQASKAKSIATEIFNSIGQQHA